MNMNLLLSLLFCLFSVMRIVTLPVSEATIAKASCNESCGGVTIPFPFGIGPSCYHDPWFEITCSSNSSEARPRPLLTKFQIEVLYIHYDRFPTLTVAIPPFNMCRSAAAHSSIDLRGSPYNFSTTLNVFTMRGCAGSSVLRRGGNKIIAGCATVCKSRKVESKTSGCYGVNCCQSPLTSGNELQDPDSSYINLEEGAQYMDYYKVEFDNQTSDSNQSCLISTLVESSSATNYFSNNSTTLAPAVLVWNVPVTFSHDGIQFLPDRFCYKDNQVGGLRCGCSSGYKGNPYLPNGCQVVNECKKCKDRCIGIYETDKFYCEKKPFMTLAAILGPSIGVGVVLLVACCYWMYRVVKKRRVMKRKAKYFKRNGGFLLQQQLSSREGGLEKAKIFTSCELEKATDHFNQDRILGQGGQGTVYKGMLTNGKIVAIKKSKQVDESQLESEVPLLVYQFIPNGTLAEHIYDPDEDFHLTWKMQLKIASESAGAIAYLHSSSSPPIYHRDIKSSNILLDEKNRAKVADFGSSRTIAIDQTHLTTVVQGTMGYLDPEYFQTYQFTDKSDVYSFGVVLLELLTSKKPIFRGESMEQKNLVTEFLFAIDSGELIEFLDPQVLEEAEEDTIFAVTDLARRCLSWNSKMRPTMKEVTIILETLVQTPNQVAILHSEAFPEDGVKQHLMTDEISLADSHPASSGSSVQDTNSTEAHPLNL